MDTVKKFVDKAQGEHDTSEEPTKFSSGYHHPPQTQSQPGLERDIHPKPAKTHLPTEDTQGYQLYKAAGKLTGKKALITGGDSGIGRAIAILFAMEGAAVAITYLPEEEEDAQHTKAQVEKNNGHVVLLASDLRSPTACREVVERAITALGGDHLDVLVNNAGYQQEQIDIADITEEQYRRTLQSNLDATFFLSKFALPHMPSGGSIINTASVDAYAGPPAHVDYAASKGAIIAFTRALANQQAARGIRVNAVAPGPVWTPLITASLGVEAQKGLPGWTTMGRIGQPVEAATSFVFLASQDGSFMTGQTMHPNGGIAVGS
ncbi:oxidoreductase [Diaporthe sp. PMI_573]|nr:oxidoreductase [Diaporthaceae sp. PMI_573]